MLAVRVVAVRAVAAARAAVRVVAASAVVVACWAAVAAPCRVGRGPARKVAAVMGCSHRNSGSSDSLRCPSRLSRKHLRRGGWAAILWLYLLWREDAAVRVCLVSPGSG